MNPILQTLRSGAHRFLISLLLALTPVLVTAADLTASIEAASRAADEATRAAEKALSAATAAASENLAPEAARQALRAAEAAKAAADASVKALAAARAAAAAAPSAAAPAAVAATQASPSAGGDSPYAEHVKCEGNDCKIDLWMTRGFRAFSQCQVCHGLDGNGSSFAPSLVEKLKEIDRARFVTVVTEGYTGQVGVMPGWKENPNVMKYLENLYAYLKARSDGALPAGKLKRYDR